MLKGSLSPSYSYLFSPCGFSSAGASPFFSYSALASPSPSASA
jgi:hypothetical protein